MRCHYDVLNVPRDAELAEIKAAYKKLALKWHPDKNLDNQEHAKEQFQLVQQAYEVLSDRQERAWYDNHREQILRGSNSGFEDCSLDVFQYFTSTCFKGYGDDKNGFYTIYREVFEKIAKEDLEYMENKEEFCNIPMFGTSQSDYENIVKPFYDYWSSYSTKKSFVWLDPFKINEIRDRRTLKIAEKENKKVRQQARKERNEEVRALVAFVRKRDKRVQAHLQFLEAKRFENKQKSEQLKLQKKRERREQLSKETGQPEWAKFDNVKSELKEIEKSLAEQFAEDLTNSEDDEEEEEDDNDLYCVACNKVFKTPKTFKNHESSKKHRENVALLKEAMRDEEESSEEDSGRTQEGNDSENECGIMDSAATDDNVEDVDDDENSEEIIIKSKKKNKKQKSKTLFVDSNNEVEADILNELDVAESDIDFEIEKQKKKKAKKNNKRIAKGDPQNENNVAKAELYIDKNGTEEDVACDRTTKSKRQTSKSNEPSIDTSHCCATCRASFPSKNKLFDHLKKSGHSVYLPNSKTSNVKQKKKSLK